MSERARIIYELVVPPKATIEPQGLNPTDSDVDSSPAPELSPDLLDVAKDLGLISSSDYEEAESQTHGVSALSQDEQMEMDGGFEEDLDDSDMDKTYAPSTDSDSSEEEEEEEEDDNQQSASSTWKNTGQGQLVTSKQKKTNQGRNSSFLPGTSDGDGNNVDNDPGTSDGDGNNVDNDPGTSDGDDHNVDNDPQSVSHQGKANKPWARAVRKERTLLINSGQSYINTSGKEIPRREMKDLKHCKKKCFIILEADPALRSTIFKEYWGLGSRNERATFIGRCLISKQVERHVQKKKNSKKIRNVTYEYGFEINGERKVVCKDCFLSTLGEKERFVRYTAEKKKSSVTGIVVKDQRGKTSLPANKTSELVIEEVRDHIKSFPTYKSHYTRRTNDKNYLPSHLNLQTMYDLYKNNHNNPVSIKIYTREFKTFNLAFKKPNVDTCHNCDTLHMKLKVAKESRNKEEELEVEKQLNAHQEKADLAYTCKKKDKEQADETKKCYSFDLQQCLPTPFLCSGVAFYKRQLWTYNLTIHDNATGESFNYMWHEATAGRGANEVASCLYQHISKLPHTVREITFYSDTCGGQNKNSHVSVMFMKAVSDFQHIHTINHKFLVPGHTHMECDVDHSIIEKRKKKTQVPIYHPHDWYQLVRSCGKKNPFVVHEMKQDNFFNFSQLLKEGLVLKKRNDENEQFFWRNVQWFQYVNSEVGIVGYKESLVEDVPFRKINFKRRGKNILSFTCKKAYNGIVPISLEKKNDLLDLLPLIPPLFHEFYRSLTTHASQACDIDPDLRDVNIDEENIDSLLDSCA